MQIVPLNKRSLLVSIAVVGVAGAGLTLAHQINPGSSSANDQRSSTSIDVTPSLSTQGVVENPPVDVKIDGKSVDVPADGTASMSTANGTATVRVNGDHTTVTRQESRSTPASSDSLNISVQSSSSGNADGDSRIRYRSKSSSSSHNSVEIQQKGNTSVQE